MYFYPEDLLANFRSKIKIKQPITKENEEQKVNTSPSEKSVKLRWKIEEIQILKRLYPNNRNDYIAKILNKSIKSINSKSCLLKLKKTSQYRKSINKHNNSAKKQAWVDKEIEYLKQNYKIKSYVEIGEKLKRTSSAIFQKARQLNLKKYK